MDSLNHDTPWKRLSLNLEIGPPSIYCFVKSIKQSFVVEMLIEFAFRVAALQTVDDVLFEFRKDFLRNGVDVILLHGVATHCSDSLDCLVAKRLLDLLRQLLFVVHYQVFDQADEVLVYHVQVGGCPRRSLQYVLHLELLTLSRLRQQLVLLLQQLGLLVLECCKVLRKTRNHHGGKAQLNRVRVYTDTCHLGFRSVP